MPAGGHLCAAGDPGEQFFAARFAVAVGNLQPLCPTHVFAHHLDTVDEYDQRGGSLGAARVQPHIDEVFFRDVELVFTIGRKHVGEADAAARHDAACAQGEGRCACSGGGDGDLGQLGDRLADGQAGRVARSRQVLVHERGRHGQRPGDVAEAVDFDFGGQGLLGVDIHTDQVTHRGHKFVAVESLYGHMPHMRLTGSRFVERAFQIGHHSVHIGLRGL